MKQDHVCHKSDSLVITIPTSCPAALHGQLLQGITEAMELVIDHSGKKTDTLPLISLLTLQKVLIPDEPELIKAYS